MQPDVILNIRRDQIWHTDPFSFLKLIFERFLSTSVALLLLLV